ncbi:MAG: hypothetical protein ACRD3G_11105 [Vicinamibacterales bacterium]
MRQLLEPILDNGVSNPHYFEGRLLTAAALREDQEAHRARQRQLGRALGPGIAAGLWVTIESAGTASTPPLLRVQAGLAINGNGQTLELPADEIVALARTTQPETETTGLFKTCEPPSTQVEGLGEGFYVLVISPASAFKGRAPASGLADPTAGAGCGSRSAIEGVRFRRLPFDPLTVTGVSAMTRQQLQNGLLGATSAAGLSRLRNVIAHLCLGTEPLMRFARDPFEREAEASGGTEAALADYGVLDDMTDAGTLTECDVPIALLHWRVGGLAFVDNWAVRRRLAPASIAASWPTLSGGRRPAEADAVLFQFQEQLASVLQAASTPATIRATDYFRWLPPVGVLPVGGGATGKAVDYLTFLQNIVYRPPVFLEGDRLPPLVHGSRRYAAFDVDAPTMLWLYATRENSQAIHAGGAVPPAFLVFANGQMPFHGHARFDVSKWDYANASLAFDEGVFA